MKTNVLLVFALLFLSSFGAIAGPALNITPNALFSLSYVVGTGPSASQMVVLQSSQMGTTSGNITVNGSTHFDVSLDNVSFSNLLTIPYSGDTLAPTNLYVRLKAGLPVSIYNYNNELIYVVANSLAPFLNVSGLVSSLPITITIMSQSATSAQFGWFSTLTSPDSYAYQLDQSPNPPTGNGTLSANPSYTATGLTPNTTYYFHARNKYNINYTSWATISFTTNPTGVEPNSINAPLIMVAPNPNLGTFTVSSTISDGSNKPADISIINAIGQTVWTKHTMSVNGQISETFHVPLPSGIYILNLAVGNEVRTTRINICK